MKQDINKILALISDSESFNHDDNLSQLINEDSEDELSEDELDLVSAAAKPDYEKFKKYLESKQN